MLSSLLKRIIGALILSKDGEVSLTKLAAASYYLYSSVLFIFISIKHGFIAEMWLIQGTLCVTHAGWDKGMQLWKAYKEKKNAISA